MKIVIRFVYILLILWDEHHRRVCNAGGCCFDARNSAKEKKKERERNS